MDFRTTHCPPSLFWSIPIKYFPFSPMCCVFPEYPCRLHHFFLEHLVLLCGSVIAAYLYDSAPVVVYP